MKQLSCYPVDVSSDKDEAIFMILRHVVHPPTNDPLSSWSLNSIPHRIVDHAVFPPLHQARFAEREESITAFLKKQLKDLGVCLNIPASVSNPNDFLAKLYYESGLQQKGQSSDYYWRYLFGASENNSEWVYPLRYVGLMPSAEVPLVGVVIYIKAFNLGFESEEISYELLAKNGFAVFSLDLLDHGLSAHFNPYEVNQESQLLSAEHVLQFFREVQRIMEFDPRLKGLNLFLIGCSQGCLYSALALARSGFHHGFKKVFFDSPTFEVGALRWESPYYEREYQRIIEGLEGSSSSRKEFIENYYWPLTINPWKSDPRLDERQMRFYEEYFKSHFGSGHWSLQYAYINRAHRIARYQLLEKDPLVFPPMMISLEQKNYHCNPLCGIDFALSFGDQNTILRRVDHHVAFPYERKVIQDVIDFFKEDLNQNAPHFWVGPESIIRARSSFGTHESEAFRAGHWRESFRYGIYGKAHG